MVRAYQGLAVRTALLITRNAADAHDAAQDAFVKAYYAMATFRSGAAFRPWLLRIVANEAIDRQRGRRRSLRLTARLAQRSTEPDAAPSAETAVVQQEQHRRLMKAINALRPQDRLVVAYRYFFELSEAETAEALGCPPGTVKSRLSRALRRLESDLAAPTASPGPVRPVADHADG